MNVFIFAFVVITFVFIVTFFVGSKVSGINEFGVLCAWLWAFSVFILMVLAIVFVVAKVVFGL